MTNRLATPMQALVSAGLFFCFWLAILYAGADHPPPPGFLLIVGLTAVCALTVYFRVPTYINWYRERKAGRRLYVLLDGLIAGVICALLVAVFPGGGEPSVTPSITDRVIWFAVLGTVGIVNALILYCANVLAIIVINRRD